MVNEELRDMFFIIKGQYTRKKPIVEYGENEFHIGAFNPEDFETKEWYRVLDRRTGRCIHAGTSLEKALNSIRREIIRGKTLKGYLSSLTEFSEKKNKRMFEMDMCVDEEYGYYFREMVREMEDEAFGFLAENTNAKRAKRRFKKIETGVELSKKEEEKPKKEKSKSKGLVMHKIKLVRA